MEQTLLDYVFCYCPSDLYRLKWICHNCMAIFSRRRSQAKPKGHTAAMEHEQVQGTEKNLVV